MHSIYRLIRFLLIISLVLFVIYEPITVQSFHFMNKLNRIGLYSSAGSKYFNGNLDNIRVYNRVLSQAEITEIVNAKQ